MPTLDTARYTSLLDTLLSQNVPLLFVGPTGTGKTVYVQKHARAAGKDGWSSIFLNFSAQTTANQTQDIIDAKLDKRRKGVFGPPLGKQCVIFVDDLNMPALETYGAQPPIEILRQFMDHEGWYDRKENVFRKLVDLSFVAAMGPPGGGRNQITPRYMRHFNIIAYTPFDDASMQRIFQTILDWWLRKEGFEPASRSSRQPIVAATMDIYKARCISLLPTPSKSHYTFNLRDFARVVQGMLHGSARRARARARLHAALGPRGAARVLRPPDRRRRPAWFSTSSSSCQQALRADIDELFDRPEQGGRRGDRRRARLLFGDYLTREARQSRTSEVKDLELQRRWRTYLEEYNAISPSR